MLLNVTLPQLLFLPPLLLVVSGLALFNFQTLFRFLSTNLKGYMTIPAVQRLKPYVDNLRFALEQVLGKASAFKFNVSHVLMMAVVIMLLAIYNAIQKSNELHAKQLQVQLARQKPKRE